MHYTIPASSCSPVAQRLFHLPLPLWHSVQPVRKLKRTKGFSKSKTGSFPLITFHQGLISMSHLIQSFSDSPAPQEASVHLKGEWESGVPAVQAALQAAAHTPESAAWRTAAGGSAWMHFSTVACTRSAITSMLPIPDSCPFKRSGVSAYETHEAAPACKKNKQKKTTSKPSRREESRLSPRSVFEISYYLLEGGKTRLTWRRTLGKVEM